MLDDPLSLSISYCLVTIIPWAAYAMVSSFIAHVLQFTSMDFPNGTVEEIKGQRYLLTEDIL